MQHVFIVGAKSLGAYGGYETFVYKLTEYHQHNGELQYHVACKANGDGCMDETRLPEARPLGNDIFELHNARCFKIKVPSIGPAGAIYFDIAALKACCRYIEEHHIPHPIVYILACRIGPIAAHFQKRIHKLGGKVFLNPDGHEWKRAKWNAFVRKYWKLSEGMMVRHSDLVVCDSTHIETYIHVCYDGKGPKGAAPRTTYIAYGAETRGSVLPDDAPQYTAWLRDKGLEPGGYYLVVGRFVPENNYETMIREFMESTSPRDFAIITNVNDKFLEQLEDRLHFKNDSRIKFVGTVYDQELLKKIRENAWAYLHGHEVGGTNPSLLEALGSTELNLLLDVGFNREVAEDAALYWTKEPGSLSDLIQRADNLSSAERKELGAAAKQRIAEAYSWAHIAQRYFDIFMREGNS